MSEELDIAESKKDSQEKLQEDLAHYRKVMYFMGANIPIECLCLPKAIETILKTEGCTRVYDLLNRDLAEIKGLGKRRLDLLTSRLDEFVSVRL